MTNTDSPRGKHYLNRLPFSPLTDTTLASMTATYTGSEARWLTQHDVADALVQRLTGREYASIDYYAMLVSVGDR